VKWVPDDVTIATIMQDPNTLSWNPVTYAIFYWRSDILKMMIESKKVNMRQCLTAPFLVEVPKYSQINQS
jgi:hypothetical protein